MWICGTPGRQAFSGPAIVLVAAAVAGCGSRQAYPKLWPALDRSSSCEQIVGTYSDEGIAGTSGSTSLSLLLIEGVTRSQSVTDCNAPEGQLKVSLDDGGGAGPTYGLFPSARCPRRLNSIAPPTT